MREIMPSSQNLLLEVKEVKMGNFKVCARRSVPNHISAWGPGVMRMRSGDLAAHHTTGFEHLAQVNIVALITFIYYNNIHCYL